MSLLFNIIYAAHANGTHHKLALDALQFMQGGEAARWRKVFLQHSERYLEGSKDPDKKFKDFKNHVYHVRDNGWGGAPGKAREWYDKTVLALMEQDFEDAVYSAGVLSHYYTDPIMPLHTAQSEAENVIHRAAEWSVAKSYSELWKDGVGWARGMRVELSSDLPDFVEEMVRQGAVHSNQYYESLIAHYDFDLGVVDPPLGYSEQGQKILSGLLVYAAVNFSQILDRAIAESGVSAPDVNLTAETVVAGLKIPIRWVTNKIENAEERKAIEAMYDELQQTGTVDKTLSEDDRAIRDLHKTEVLRSKSGGVSSAEAAEAQEAIEVVRETINQAARAIKTANLDLDQAVEAKQKQRRPRGAKFYLEPSDKVEDAPSIGKKTAERLAKAGIRSVGDLLAADPDVAAADVGARHITAEVIISWQAQAQLVCDLPKLRGTYAKLLVGAGFPDVNAVAKADAPAMLTAVEAFCQTSEGERALGSMKEPDLDMVEGWIYSAIDVLESKAA